MAETSFTDINLWHMAFLLIMGLVAGTINAMAGGGGLLTIPSFMALGLTPLQAIATNFPTAIAANSSATLRFWQHGELDMKTEFPRALIAFAFGILGGTLVQHIPNDFLKILIPVLLILICIWLVTNPQAGHAPGAARISPVIYTFCALPLLGLYDGFFGPCSGTFYALSAVSLLGTTLSRATANAKLYNTFGGLGGFVSFFGSSNIHWTYAAIVMVGCFIGSYIGASLVIKHGTRLVRLALVVVSMSMSVKLLFDQPFFQKLIT
ncbi:MAG: TSUP family transporter [Alphaproteobacteria bacterium]|nr:TSUP family transporter [Alphaproteobacteria bacterium]